MQLHRNLTSPPSLWPGRELRKYHYPSAPVVARPVAIRSLLHWLYRSAFRVMAGLQPGSVAPHLTAQGMYLSGCVFSCQGSLIDLLYFQGISSLSNVKQSMFYAVGSYIFCFFTPSLNSHREGAKMNPPDTTFLSLCTAFHLLCRIEL